MTFKIKTIRKVALYFSIINVSEVDAMTSIGDRTPPNNYNTIQYNTQYVAEVLNGAKNI